MDGGTTKWSGWGVFLFILGFTVFATSAIGGGALSVILGAAIILASVGAFKVAREKEGL